MSQQPIFHITKEHFVGVINSLQAQFQKDKASAEAFGQIFNTNDAGFYDNSSLINAIFSFLHEVFPKDDDGHSELLHYCYECNFGKVGEHYESPEELYDRLTAGKGILFQIENSTDYAEADESKVKAIRNVLRDIGYPVAPEEAFLQDESGQFPGHKAGKDKDGAFYFVKSNNPFSTGIQWISNKEVDKIKAAFNTITDQEKKNELDLFLKNFPSPDETH